MIYSKLRTLRKKNHYTSEYMSKMLKISKPFYCKLENGTRKLSYEMAIQIASIFKMKPDTIFYNDYIKEKKESSQNR